MSQNAKVASKVYTYAFEGSVYDVHEGVSNLSVAQKWVGLGARHGER